MRYRAWLALRWCWWRLGRVLWRTAPVGELAAAAQGLGSTSITWERDDQEMVYRLTVPDWALFEAGPEGLASLRMGLEGFIVAATSRTSASVWLERGRRETTR